MEDIRKFAKMDGFSLVKKTPQKEKLPYFSHPGCGPSSQNQVTRTKKQGFYWRCVICGETRFFSELKNAECNHSVAEKLTKNGFLTSWCPVCRIRIFRRPTDEELLKFNKKEVIAK